MFKGFSLLECLVAIAIASILIVGSFPMLSHLLVNYRSAMAKQSLISILNSTRMLAVTKQRLVTICPMQDATHCSNHWQLPLSVFIDHAAEAKLASKSDILHRYTNHHYGELSFKAFPSARYLRYTSQGFTDAQNGTFTYCYHQQGWQLIINRSGRIREKAMQCE
jgi:type IV fimbrial biogenesis protein FimT